MKKSNKTKIFVSVLIVTLIVLEPTLSAVSTTDAIFARMSEFFDRIINKAENQQKQEKNEEKIIIQLQTGDNSNFNENSDYFSNSISEQITTFENSISITSEDLEYLINELQLLQEEINNTEDLNEKIQLYSKSIDLLKQYKILPESFTIDAILASMQEITSILYNNKNILPNLLDEALNTINTPRKSNYNMNSYPSYENNVNTGDFRLDIGSAFFVLTLLSEMIPINIIKFPAAEAIAIEINITDLTIGQILADLIPGMKKFTLPIGFIAGIGYAELLSVPGNALIGGQSIFSWPQAIPFKLYLYSGSSLILPIAFGFCSITILLDRGPKQVPVPLLDVGIFGSSLTVHMPYAKNPNQN